MLKAGLMLGFGAGVLTAVVASSKMKSTIMEQGKKAIKDKIIKVLGFLNLYARNNPRTPSRPYHRAPGPGI